MILFLKNKALWEPSVKDILIALSVEAFEALEHTDFKWWSLKKRFDRYELMEEGVDILHFLISFFRKINFGACDVFNKYEKKNVKNLKRAKSDY